MVAISIFTLVVSISLANLTVAKAKGRDAKRGIDAEQMNTALTSYSLDNNGVPAGSSGAGCSAIYNGSGVQTSWMCSSNGSQGLGTVLSPLVTGSYMSAVPNDPSNSGGLAYYYVTGLAIKTSPSGVPLAQDASFRFVSESRSTPGNPYILGNDYGTVDYTAFPTYGYPVGPSGGSGIVVPGTQLPDAPAAPAFQSVCSFSLSLTWPAPNTYGLQINQYNIYSSGSFLMNTKSAPVGIPVSANTHYTFTISAVTDVGESAQSGGASVTTPRIGCLGPV